MAAAANRLLAQKLRSPRFAQPLIPQPRGGLRREVVWQRAAEATWHRGVRRAAAVCRL